MAWEFNTTGVTALRVRQGAPMCMDCSGCDSFNEYSLHTWQCGPPASSPGQQFLAHSVTSPLEGWTFASVNNPNACLAAVGKARLTQVRKRSF